MNPDFAVELIQTMILKAVYLASPILMIAMTVGLTVSLMQTVTSINEQTLSFVPKTLAIVTFLVMAASWIIRTVVEYARGIIQLMSQMTG